MYKDHQERIKNLLALNIFHKKSTCCLYLNQTKFIFCTDSDRWLFLQKEYLVGSKMEITISFDDVLNDLSEKQQEIILFNLDLFR